MDELKPHQLEAVGKLDSGKILVGGVGTGKSWAAMEYYMQKESPRDIFIITTAKKRDSLDWVGEAARYGIGRSQDATVAGVLTVDSWNNIGNYTSVHDAFFIFDEQRLVGSGEWSKAFIHIAKSNRWILLSATPGDNWLDYIPVFVANGFYRNRTQFKREHVVYNTFTKFPKVDHYIGVHKLVKLRNHLLVEMPMERHTTRNTEIVNVAYDRDLFEKVMVKRWHVYENRPLRDVAELFSVMRKVVNSDDSRLREVRHLLSTHKKLIVFYNFDYELEILRTLATSMGATDSSQTVCSEPTTTSKSINQESEISNTSNTSSTYQNQTLSDGSSNTRDETQSLRKLSPSLERSDSRSSKSSKSNLSLSTWSRSGLLSETSLLKSSSDGTKKLTSEKCEPTQPLATTTSYNKDHGSKRSVSAAIHGSPQKSSPKNATFTTKSTMSGSMSPRSRLNAAESNGATTFQVAEWNGHKHQPIPETDSWVYLVQYTAGSEGWNCIETNAMVFYSLTYSYKQFHQAHGRIDRMNTPYTQLYYYVFRSNSAIDKAVWGSLSAKKSFNESAWRKKLEKKQG